MAGKLLGHNVTGADGRLALRKGRPLTTADVALLRTLGRASVYVAEPAAGDVGEDEAARRVAEAARGGGLKVVGPSSGRANLVATTPQVGTWSTGLSPNLFTKSLIP